MKYVLKFIFILPLICGFSACKKDTDEIRLDSITTGDAKKIPFKKQGEVYFQDSLKNVIKKIDVEIAETDEARHLGLMFREEMTEDQGMLFIFPVEEIQGFYMKNTIMSLDIIFVNSRKQIVKIYQNTEPFSEKTLSSHKPCLFVVEVLAGFCSKYGIKEGYYIDWRRN